MTEFIRFLHTQLIRFLTHITSKKSTEKNYVLRKNAQFRNKKLRYFYGIEYIYYGIHTFFTYAIDTFLYMKKMYIIYWKYM